MKNQNQRVVRKGHLQQKMQEHNMILWQQLTRAVDRYHNEIVEPRMRRIEMILVLPYLWDRIVTFIHFCVRKLRKPKAPETTPGQQ